MSLVFLEAKLESLAAEGCHLELAMTEDGVRLVDVPDEPARKHDAAYRLAVDAAIKDRRGYNLAIETPKP